MVLSIQRFLCFPNRDDRLAPGRRENSIACLERGVLGYGNFILTWRAFVFWRVCEAIIERASLSLFGLEVNLRQVGEVAALAAT